MNNLVKYGTLAATLAIGVGWLSVGSFSDQLAGNHKMFSGAPPCKNTEWCNQIRDLFIVDAHNDTLLHRDPAKAAKAGHVDLARLVDGGVDLQIFAIASVTPKIKTQNGKPCGDLAAGDRLKTFFVLKEPLRPTTWLSPMGRVDRMIERFDRAVSRQKQNGANFKRIASKEDLNALTKPDERTQKSVGAVLAIEGAYWASEDKDELQRQFDNLEEAGVLMVGMTHRSSNHLAGSNEDCSNRHGLTELGRFFVAEVWRRGMILDLAHASSETIADVAELSVAGNGGPVVVSHTGIKAACNHDRNLSDEDVRNVVRSGGVVAIGFWSTVNCFPPKTTAEEARNLVSHSFASAYEILNTPEFLAEMGTKFDPANHLALGSDFDGATLVPYDASGIPWYLEGLHLLQTNNGARFNADALKKIAGGNMFRMIQSTLKSG